MALSNCSGYENATLHLATGSEASLEHFTITNASGYDATGIRAIDVMGSLSISNYTSLALDKIEVSYSICSTPSYLKFRNNSFDSELSLGVKCSDVHLFIEDSMFQNNKIIGLSIYFDILTKNTITISNTVLYQFPLASHIVMSSIFAALTGFLHLTKSLFIPLLPLKLDMSSQQRIAQSSLKILCFLTCYPKTIFTMWILKEFVLNLVSIRQMIHYMLLIHWLFFKMLCLPITM